MPEYKLFDGDVPYVSTFDFHKDRERAPHWEQPVHRTRLETALRFVLEAHVRSVIDLGCGDGGLVAQFKAAGLDVRGYDFQPSNIAGWKERGILDCTYPLDFVHNWTSVPYADAYVITECLEHLADPHEMVRRIFARGAVIVASSPHTEHQHSHDECHAWAWDMAGYRAMIEDAGFVITAHETHGMFQVICGQS